MKHSRPALTVTLAVAALGVGTAVLAGAGSSAAATATTAAATAPAKVPHAGVCCGTAFLRPGGQLESAIPSDSVLQSGGLGVTGDDIIATPSPYYLSLQTDGNLVEYRQNATGGRTAVWATATRSTTPVTLQFQHDGNVVLYDSAHKALWATGTAGRPAAYFDVYGNGQVVTQDAAGRVLSSSGPAQVAFPGVTVSSAESPANFTSSPPYRHLAVQTDGNLVEYVTDAGHRTRAVWASNTAGRGAVRLDAQSDGNLVLYQRSTGRAVWNSGSHGPTAYYQLDVQDDGNVVLYRTDGVRRLQAVWAVGIRH